MNLSPRRKHNRANFFKYTPASTARIVISNCTLRWSSPCLFNDPFDVPRELSHGIDPQEIAECIGRRFADLIAVPPADTSNLSPQLKLIIDTVKTGISDELRSDLLAGLGDVMKEHRPSGASMDALRALWRTWIPDLRILCLTESPTHSAMWFHYADEYRGAVLEFVCNDADDSALLTAERVNYPVVDPVIFTADGWADLIMSGQERSLRQMFNVATLTKSPDWSYENEWRVVSFRRPNGKGLFTDFPFNPRELAAVYLGPLMLEDDSKALLSIVASHPHVRVVSTSIGLGRSLEFHPVDGFPRAG